MQPIKYLKHRDSLIIINNITFLELKGSGETTIHFTGSKTLTVNINIVKLVSLIEEAIKN
jgi:hypothetical protein